MTTASRYYFIIFIRIKYIIAFGCGFRMNVLWCVVRIVNKEVLVSRPHNSARAEACLCGNWRPNEPAFWRDQVPSKGGPESSNKLKHSAGNSQIIILVHKVNCVMKVRTTQVRNLFGSCALGHNIVLNIDS